MDYNKYYYGRFDLGLDRARYDLLIKNKNINRPWSGYLFTDQDGWNWHILNTLEPTTNYYDDFYIRTNCNRITNNLEDSKILFNNSIDNSYAKKYIVEYIENIFHFKEKILANLNNKPIPKQVTQPIYWVSQFSLRDSSPVYWLANNNRLILNGYSKPVPVIINKNSQLEIILNPKENKVNGEEIYYLGKETLYGRIPNNTICVYNDCGADYCTLDEKELICKSYFNNSIDVFDNYKGALENLKERIFTEFDRIEDHYTKLLDKIESLKYQGISKPSKLLNLIEKI